MELSKLPCEASNIWVTSGFSRVSAVNGKGCYPPCSEPLPQCDDRAAGYRADLGEVLDIGDMPVLVSPRWRWRPKPKHVYELDSYCRDNVGITCGARDHVVLTDVDGSAATQLLPRGPRASVGRGSLV